MTIKKTEEPLCKWCKRIYYGTMANFLVFFVIGMTMGGATGNGKVEAGRFFLGDHGKFVEVSQNTFQILQVYERFTLSVFAIGFAAGLIGAFIPGCMRRLNWWSR